MTSEPNSSKKKQTRGRPAAAVVAATIGAIGVIVAAAITGGFGLLGGSKPNDSSIETSSVVPAQVQSASAPITQDVLIGGDSNAPVTVVGQAETVEINTNDRNGGVSDAELALVGHATQAAAKYWHLEAEETFAAAIQQYPNSSYPYVARANYFLQYYRAGEAMTDLQRALELDPAGDEARRMFRDAKSMVEQIESRVREAQLRLEANPKDYETAAFLATYYLQLGRADKALEMADHILAGDARHPTGILNRALALGRLRRWSEALEMYSSFLNLDGYAGPDYGAAHQGIMVASNALARIAVHDGNTALARSYQERFVEALAMARKLRPDERNLDNAEGGFPEIKEH